MRGMNDRENGFCYEVRPVSALTLCGMKGLFIFAAILAVPFLVAAAYQGITRPGTGVWMYALVAGGVIVAVLCVPGVYAVIEHLPASRMCARLSVTACEPRLLRIGDSSGGGLPTVLEIPVPTIFCTRVQSSFDTLSCARALMIELHNGTTHTVLQGRGESELMELSRRLNEELGISSQQERSAAWFAAQPSAPPEVLEPLSRGLSVVAHQGELAIRFPASARWSWATVVMFIFGIWPYLLLLGVLLWFTARCIIDGKSVTQFWGFFRARIPEHFAPYKWKLALFTLIFSGGAIGTILMARAWTTITVSRSLVQRVTQQGRRVRTRELDTADVEDIVFREGTLHIVSRTPLRSMTVRVRVSREEQERVRGLLLQACGLKAAASVNKG